MSRVNYRICVAIFTLCILSAIQLGAQEGKAVKSATVATFKGANITEDDLKKEAADQLERVEIQHLQAEAAYTREKHLALEAALNRVIEDKVLDAESSSRGISRQALLDKELAGKVREPTMEDLSAHYPVGKQPSADDREKIYGRMKQYLKTENYNKAKADYVAQLKKRYGVTQTFKPLRLSVETAGSPSMGSEAASVTLVEFSDFSCQACGGFETAMMDLVKKYGTQVRLVYRNFANGQPQGAMAAEAALCAGEQGRFWEMHNQLFQSGHPEPQFFNMHAMNLNLDLKNFGACLSSGRNAEKVRKDLYAAAGLGVTNSPALFVNGRPVLALRSMDDVSKLIDEELHRMAPSPGAPANTNNQSQQQASSAPGTRK